MELRLRNTAAQLTKYIHCGCLVFMCNIHLRKEMFSRAHSPPSPMYITLLENYLAGPFACFFVKLSCSHHHWFIHLAHLLFRELLILLIRRWGSGWWNLSLGKRRFGRCSLISQLGKKECNKNLKRTWKSLIKD